MFFCAYFSDTDGESISAQRCLYPVNAAVCRKIPHIEKGSMMKTVNGIYTSAKIFTDHVEDYALDQIKMLCDNEAFRGSTIRVMPDVHPGKAGTIGFTATVRNRVLPNVVGIDIGCGITLAKIRQKKAEFQKIDRVIRECIPSGFAIRKKIHRYSAQFDFSRLYCSCAVDHQKASLSIGTLGGGNHFIELDKDTEGNLYAVVHSGSRHLGKEVTEHYLREGQRYLKAKGIQVPYELVYLEAELMEKYLHDIQIVQEFASLNREAILDELIKGMKWKTENCFSSVHNYIAVSGDKRILRKGAGSAQLGERVVIPINMREGILLGEGLGNAEWNVSAPHGAGRLMNREMVRSRYTVSQFKQEMKGIYCSCINKDTLDEAPFAYRGMEEIREAVKDTVKVTEILKPIYNYKAG